MALKAEVETIEGLPEPVAKEYRQVERAGKKVFILDIEGDDLPDEVPAKQALKRARDHERKARQDAEAKVKATLDQLTEAKEALDNFHRGHVPKTSVEALDKSWGEKLAAKEKELTGRVSKAEGTVRKLLVDNVAQSIAVKLAGDNAHLMIPFAKERLTAEDTSDGFITRVLDKTGQPSAMTLEELQKDLANDARFSAIIVGSNASGSGAGGSNGGRSGAPVVDPKIKDLNKASNKDLAAHIRAKRAAAGKEE